MATVSRATVSGDVPPHPSQPTIVDRNGHVRYRENKLVTYLLAQARNAGVDLSRVPVGDDDREQVAQLTGKRIGRIETASAEPKKSKTKKMR